MVVLMLLSTEGYRCTRKLFLTMNSRASFQTRLNLFHNWLMQLTSRLLSSLVVWTFMLKWFHQPCVHCTKTWSDVFFYNLVFLKNYSEDIDRLGIPPPTTEAPAPLLSLPKKEEETASVMSKDSGEHPLPMKEMEKGATLRIKKGNTERGSSMVLNEGVTAKDRLLSKAFGKKEKPS
eukprot:NODE_25_length_41203_cov_0.917113.p17 type:complete len:177 gc:universal NODE_25_length_41203_cov_0.917113:26254-26784(+)